MYARGVQLGLFATVAAANSPKGITEDGVGNALQTVSLIQARHHGSVALASMVGGDDVFRTLHTESGEFIKRFPGLYRNMSPTKYLSGIWLGMFAGAAAAHNPTGKSHYYI